MLQSFEEFVEHFDKLRLPNRIGSALNNRLLASFIDMDASVLLISLFFRFRFRFALNCNII